MTPVIWSPTVFASYDWGLGTAWRPHWLDAIETIGSVTGYTVVEASAGAQWVTAPLDAVLTLPGIPAGWQPLAAALTVDSGGYGVVSYAGVPDVETVEAAGWSPYSVILHEIGHALGFADRPASDGRSSLYGYADPHPAGFTAADIEWMQRWHGVSSGDDRIEAHGTASGSIRGGEGDDTIIGSDSDNIIYGNQDNDLLVAGGNADTLFGGQGNDLIDGGDGADVMYGNLASDTLYGGAGLDILYGGQGDDAIYAGAGDTVFGGVGADTIWAHPLSIIGSADPLDTIIWGVWT